MNIFKTDTPECHHINKRVYEFLRQIQTGQRHKLLYGKQTYAPRQLRPCEGAVPVLFLDIANKTYVDSNFVRKNAATTMTARLTAQSNTSYTTKQVRNIVFWTSGTTPPATSYGDVVIKTF